MISIPLHSRYTMYAIIALLIIASSVSFLLRLKKPDKDFTELTQRINTWWVIILILFIVLMVGHGAAISFFALISFLALKEFLSIVPTRLADRRVLFWAYLSIPFQYYWIYISWYGMYIIFIPVYVLLILAIRLVLLGENKGFIRSLGIIHFAVMLTVFCISHIALLLSLEDKNKQAGLIGLVLFILICTQLNDVCQFIWGKLFGKHKIIPNVSPNKTWEGFIGGIVSLCLIATFIAPLLTPLTQTQGLIAGLIISFFGFFGDLVLSCVKRDLEIKDCGSLLPGHGGILDRLDSLTFTAPLFFHYLYYLHY